MNDLTPLTPIEALLQSAMDGKTPIGAFMKAFVASDVVLLTGSLVTPDGSGFDPLLFDKQGVLHVAVFTAPARVGVHSEQAPHQIRWLMLDVLRRVPGGYGVVMELVRRLNDTLGLTSVVVTHHVHETLPVADHAVVVANGGIVFSGTPAELEASDDPFVRQFLKGEPDGPIAFDAAPRTPEAA